jgi:hypothetical protein
MSAVADLRPKTIVQRTSAIGPRSSKAAGLLPAKSWPKPWRDPAVRYSRRVPASYRQEIEKRLLIWSPLAAAAATEIIHSPSPI